MNSGPKINVLSSLLSLDKKSEASHSENISTTLALIATARNVSERNAFVHDILSSDATQLIRREVKTKYFVSAKPIGVKLMYEHLVEFYQAF